MKKRNKNFLTFALAFCLVGAGAGAVAAIESQSSAPATVVKAADVYEDDVTDLISVSKVTLSSDNRSRYDVTIDFGGTAFNGSMFYTNQYPDQLGITIGDYIVINGKTLTETCAPYSTGTQAEQLEARKEWLDDLDDGTNANTSNEDWGFNKGWVPVVGQINTNNITLMIDRRLVAPTDLELTIKSGLEIAYTDADGDVLMKVTEDVSFKLIPDASNVENLKGVKIDTAEVETAVNPVALVKVADTDKTVQYQLHTDLLMSSSYVGRWNADHFIYFNDYFTLNGKTFSEWNKETYLAEYTTGAINSTAFKYSTPLLNYVFPKSAISNGSGTVFQFYISKAWMTAMDIDESTMVLGLREGFSYINADGNAAKTTNSLSYAKDFTASVVVDGETKEVKFNTLNKAEKLEEIKAMLPETTAEYSYAWKEELPTELALQDGYTFEVVKTPVEYTISFNHPMTGMILAEPITFTVETMDSVVFPEVSEDLQATATEGYKVVWNKTEADITLADLTVNPTQVAIEYTISFNHPMTGMILAEPIKFTVETIDSVEFPEVSEDLQATATEGYKVVWNKTEADVTLADLTVNPTQVAIEYTISFNHPMTGMLLAAPITFTVETIDSVVFPEVPADLQATATEGYKVVWNKTEADVTLADLTVNPTQVAIEYTISFNHPMTGMLLAQPITFTVETIDSVVFPEVSEDLQATATEGYKVVWNKTEEDVTLADLTVNPTQVAIEYTISFNHPMTGMLLAQPITFTVETIDSVVFPEVPAELAMEGYTVAWNKTVEDVTLADLQVAPAYTAIEYTATFVADGTTVGTVTYTVESTEITEPAVPEKEGYTGAWEAYELTVGGITVNAVYTENPVEEPDPDDGNETPEPGDGNEEPAPEEEGGCGSMIGGVSAAVALVGGAVLVLRKKKED